MWVTGASGVALAGNTPTSNVYSSNNNRIAGASYDAAGNQLVVNGDTLTYDAENRMTSAYDPILHNTETYVYDGNGQWVEKTGPSGTTVYVYDAFGNLAAEYGAMQGNPPCTTCYLAYDHLGSLRLVTDQNGNVVARHDFLPFGEEVPANTAGRNGQWGSTSDAEQKFTGQIRDTETQMDYFNARYFTNALGRFNSPDPENAGADPTDPQTWNAYAYVSNNPLALIDPSGMTDCDPDGNNCKDTVTVTAQPPDDVPVIWIFFSPSGDPTPPPPLPPPPVGNLWQQAVNWITAPRDPNCVKGAAVAGAALGASGGAIAGGIGGGAAGGTLGSIVPFAGNVAGAAGGAEVGIDGGAAIGGGLGYLGGMAAGYLTCASSTGGSGGGGGPELSPRARKKLGNLVNRAGERVRDVIRSRGGSASNVNRTGHWADKTLGETAEAAAKGDPTAVTAIKIVKDAGRLGQQY